MTIAQALGEGVQTTIIGLSTVFAVLIILMIVITIMKAVFYKDPKKQTEKVVESAGEALTKAVEGLPTVEETPEDEEELVAVITAAIAASLSTSTYHLKIKSLRRTDHAQSEWNKAGIHETISSTF